MTLRDEIWNVVLQRLVNNGTVTMSDLPFSESQSHTVRRVLREMESLGWLTRESKWDATWQMGPEAELQLNIAPQLIQGNRR
jgi:hypothetical protein